MVIVLAALGLISIKPAQAKFVAVSCIDGDCSKSLYVSNKDFKRNFPADKASLRVKFLASDFKVAQSVNSSIRVDVFDVAAAGLSHVESSSVIQLETKSSNSRQKAHLVYNPFVGDKVFYLVFL